MVESPDKTCSPIQSRRERDLERTREQAELLVYRRSGALECCLIANLRWSRLSRGTFHLRAMVIPMAQLLNGGIDPVFDSESEWIVS
jgi:hypothetical protein